MSSATLKITAGGLLAYWIWLAMRKPKITVLALNANCVSFEMKVNGKKLTDTVCTGDAEQTIPAGDGEHFFYYKTQTTPDPLVQLEIRKGTATVAEQTIVA